MGDDDIFEYLVHVRQQEAQTFVARERLAICLRSAPRPRQLRFSSALRQLTASCLGLPAVSRHGHRPVTPRGLHEGSGRK
jgi:hypothetical protein